MPIEPAVGRGPRFLSDLRGDTEFLSQTMTSWDGAKHQVGGFAAEAPLCDPNCTGHVGLAER